MRINNSINISESWLERLRSSGYRLTAPRVAVVNTLAGARQALNPMQILQRAAPTCPSLGLVTVYRTLERLEALNLVQRVHLHDGCHAYIAAASGHEHLLICSMCNHAEYFSGDDLEPLMGEVGAARGFTIQDHWLQLFGTCPDCQKRAASAL